MACIAAQRHDTGASLSVRKHTSDNIHQHGVVRNLMGSPLPASFVGRLQARVRLGLHLFYKKSSHVYMHIYIYISEIIAAAMCRH